MNIIKSDGGQRVIFDRGGDDLEYLKECHGAHV